MPEGHGEFARIRALLAALPRGEGVIVGPGDDAAVLRPTADRDIVVTTDTFVERQHFEPATLASATGIGRRLAAANLSDLAAMAAEPRWALLACLAPPAIDAAIPHAIELACAEALAAAGAAIVGGNLSATDGPLAFSVTLLGEVERGAAWTRAGARAGDLLAVTGCPGRAGAALQAADAAWSPARAQAVAALLAARLRPAPRVAFARSLAARALVHAAIDLSDGLAGDLAHLCEASGVGARIETTRMPADALLASALGEGPADERALARGWFGASDDYELLLAIAPADWPAAAALASAAQVPLHAIGACTAVAGRLTWLRADGSEAPLPGAGYDHFA